MELLSKKRGFTLIELSVSALIIGLISIVLILVLRSNLAAWQWGQKHMEFNQHVQLIMKQIFTDLKNINPIVQMDAEGHLWFQGERGGDIRPNLVTIYDNDSETTGYGQELVFFLTSFSDLNRRDRIKYFINEEGELIREIQDAQSDSFARVIAPIAKDLRFRNDPYDLRQVSVELTIVNPEDENMSETLDFSVRLETDLVSVRLVRTYAL